MFIFEILCWTSARIHLKIKFSTNERFFEREYSLFLIEILNYKDVDSFEKKFSRVVYS